MLVLIIASCPQTESKRRPVKYLIPAGYTGWVKINFQVPIAPALPIEDGNYVAQIPANAELQTSSDIEYGSAKDEYYYYDADGKHPLKVSTWGGGGMIWGGFTGQQSNSTNQVVQTYLQFFVGAEEEYKKRPAPERSIQTEPLEK
jgi:hypothetical protein